jgi:hypothetical protein
MTTNNKAALQPCWDNLIWKMPTPSWAAPASPAARVSALKSNVEAMGRALNHKVQGVAKELQPSVTENGCEARTNHHCAERLKA